MNWKQPNHGVFLRIYCGYPSDTLEPRKSIKESIKFCKSYDVLGIISHSRAFHICPELIKQVKESGLLFILFGDDVDVTLANVDGTIQQGVLKMK
jgi:hypothetical protein